MTPESNGAGAPTLSTSDLRKWSIVHYEGRSWLGSVRVFRDDYDRAIAVDNALDYLLQRAVDPRTGQVAIAILLTPAETLGPLDLILPAVGPAVVSLSNADEGALEALLEKVHKALAQRPRDLPTGAQRIVMPR